jgi:hypothetical protein
VTERFPVVGGRIVTVAVIVTVTPTGRSPFQTRKPPTDDRVPESALAGPVTLASSLMSAVEKLTDTLW